MTITREEFLKELDRATAIVESWPAWKQEVVSEALINSPWRKGSPQRQNQRDKETEQQAIFNALAKLTDYEKHLLGLDGQASDETTERGKE
jgi:hypothetical protein